MPAVPVIAMERVSFAYDKAAVLDEIDLTVQPLELISVVGPNGGGKTTLLKLLLGLLSPDRGTLRIFGAPPQDVRRRIGYMPQHATYDPLFPVSVLEVVTMGRLERHVAGAYARTDRQAARDALEEVDLAPLAQRPFGALSGGERQRVLLARALVSEPELLLLDEPTASVDSAIEEKLSGILRDLNRRMTIVMVSHDLGFVTKIVKSVVCVNRRLFVHPTSELTGELIRDMYQRDLLMVRHDHRCLETGHHRSLRQEAGEDH